MPASCPEWWFRGRSKQPWNSAEKQLILNWCSRRPETRILKNGILILIDQDSWQILSAAFSSRVMLTWDQPPKQNHPWTPRGQLQIVAEKGMSVPGVRAEGWARRVGPHGCVFYSRAGVTRWFATLTIKRLQKCRQLKVLPIWGNTKKTGFRSHMTGPNVNYNFSL